MNFCSQLMANVKELADAADEANNPVTEEEKDDPNKQHFKYLLQICCDAGNESLLSKLEGGTCEIQGKQREVLVKCMLKVKGKVFGEP